jgi:hypothetical protein
VVPELCSSTSTTSATASVVASYVLCVLRWQAGRSWRKFRDDQAEPTSQGHARKNVNTSFTLSHVTLDAPGHAVAYPPDLVRGGLGPASGRVVQRTAPAAYQETYTVEFMTGAVRDKNDL